MIKLTNAVIVAAGSSSRMQSDIPKILLPLAGKTVIRRTMEAFEQCAVIHEFVVVCRKENVEAIWQQGLGLHKLKAVVTGGDDRQASVAKGVDAVSDCDLLVIHDGARPCIRLQEIESVCKAGQLYGAATLAVQVKDTIKTADLERFVVDTPDRSALWQIQTPQVFATNLYMQARSHASNLEQRFTDDCQLVEQYGQKVFLQEGRYDNIKITTQEDMLVAQTMITGGKKMRIGHGYDVHRLVKGRPLLLGGVRIPHAAGLLGHSDADVLLHAVADALLGAAGLGDIGGMFPDTDPSYAGADSLVLLQTVVAAVEAAGYGVCNVDCTLIAQEPKLKLYLPQMAAHIAAACKITCACVNVKATTEEHLGFSGRKEGMSAHAVCLLT